MESGRDVSKFSNIKVIKTLDEVEDMDCLWIFEEKDFRILVDIAIAKKDETEVELSGGRIIVGEYHAETKTAHYVTTKSIRKERIAYSDLQDKEVYKFSINIT